MKILSADEQIHFKDWIRLNTASITWEGRYLKEFNDFWLKIFAENSSIEDQFLRLNRLINYSEDGPIISWFKWLKFKFIAFLYIEHGYSIREISSLSSESPSEISTYLRDFYLQRFPNFEDELNDMFQVADILSENLDRRHLDVKNKIEIDKKIIGSVENEVLASLEVTLYPEWGRLFEALIDKSDYRGTSNKFQIKNMFGDKFQFFTEVIILFFLGAILIFSVKMGNTIYEDYLVKSISLFEPNFLKLDTTLSFQSDKLKSTDLNIKIDELENLEKIESKKIFQENNKAQRYEVESDVVLTSIDALPKDFDNASLEQSEYEELRKGGYRNSRYGRKKAYRVMMTSVDPKVSKRKILPLLNKYKVQQVDNVKPGTEIPGGIYFNLYVKRAALQKFLAELNGFGEATILESRTSKNIGPAGTDKVFIWIKSI